MPRFGPLSTPTATYVATINVNTNGTITLVTGSNDLSGTRTSVAMQAAEVLGLDVEDVISTVGDTDSAGWSGVANGSKITYSTGLAAIAAAEEVELQMSARAALMWEVQREDVEFKDGVFVCTRKPADRITFRELAARLMSTGGPISCTGYTFPTGPGGVIFGGNIVDVEVDPETGKVEILRYTTFTDVGKAVHPSFDPGVIPAGAFDQRPVEARHDVLVYSTPPLENYMEVTGPITVTLYASSSAPDTDFTAKLVDVRPDGYARNLTDGIIRARYRESASTPSLLEPGKVYRYTIDLWATSNVFKTGHHIRVEISSSNFPRFDRNTNTGNLIAEDRECKPALQTIFHDAEHPSHITLPTVPR